MKMSSPSTPDSVSDTTVPTWSVVRCSQFIVMLLAWAVPACGPVGPDDSDSLGDETDSGTDSSDTGEVFEGLRCVEISGYASCWIGYGQTWALVALECQVKQAIAARVWGPAYDTIIEDFGAVTCHEIVSSDAVVCLLGPDQIVLTNTGVWSPSTDDTIHQLPEADPPCEWAPCEEHPGSLGCPCGGGDCVAELVCNGVGCTPCPEGSPVCPCGTDQYCESDVCLSSADWSVCVPPEGPILCVAGECPGDMICGEPALQYCAWPTP